MASKIHSLATLKSGRYKLLIKSTGRAVIEQKQGHLETFRKLESYREDHNGVIMV